MIAIHARADIRLAEEYKAAQDRGEVAAVGGVSGKTNVHAEDIDKPATTAELGIDRRDISEGRKLKETEEADPGVINRGLLKVGAEVTT
ncbi:MAG TPA: hypothetical protein DIU07_19940 [Rhodobacteraceae bacterium]|nr:hypothetical protein [Paracoccaceae bacterium]